MTEKASLAPLIVAGGLVIVAVLVISLLLLMSGFLKAPFLAVGLAILVSVGILGLSIGAAVLSRRP